MSAARIKRLELPVIAAPMFLVSTPTLVAACCREGVVGVFPTHNARTAQELDKALAQMGEAQAMPGAAPFAVNIVLRDRSTPRFSRDLEAVARYRVPVVITSNGDPAAMVERVHQWGGIVLHDVTTVRHARKAVAAGVDGLILVCAGAGGHAGRNTPLAFVPEVRAFFDGLLVVGGGIVTGAAVHAVRVLGADMAYMGTRFLATVESGAPPEYKRMLLAASSDDVIYTSAVSGLPASFLVESMRRQNLDLDVSGATGKQVRPHLSEGVKAWRDVWSAGQGVGCVDAIQTVSEVIAFLRGQYHQATASAVLPSQQLAS